VTGEVLRISGGMEGVTGGLRVNEEDEQAGLDLATHGERGYDM
jgi:ammonia channel protein AmtB